MSDANEKSNNGASNNACVVCYRNANYYSIGMCEHPVCYECSTRMRVLCQQNECPICRQELPKVVFTKEIKPFRFLKKGNLLDSRYNIFFESPEIQKSFNRLLSHACKICPDQVFNSFNGLKEHMRKKHDLHYCDLCVDNLKIFSRERRCYTKAELSQHRRKGDSDDKSHKGHPLCEFCDKRYMDTDELYRHLRRDHLFCHFCDADGLHHYYSSYDYLREHFRKEHYLCEEGGCADEQFTSVFRSDIDLKAHKASVHGKQLGKAAAKQARTLELEFSLAPRNDFRQRRGDRGDNRGQSRDEASGSSYSRNPHIYQRPESPPPSTEEPTFVRQQPVDVQSTQEFPTLGNAPAAPNLAHPVGNRGRGNLTIRGVLNHSYNENFPALGPDAPAAGGSSGAPSTASTLTKSFNVKVSSSKPSSAASAGGKAKSTPNVSIHVNHRLSNGTVMTRLTGPSLRINSSIPSAARDFPALGRTNADVAAAAAAPPSASNPSSWTKVTCVRPEAMPQGKKVAPAPHVPLPPPIRSGEDFPSLSKPSKSSGNKNSSKPSVPAPAGPSWMQVLQTTDTSSGSSVTADATKGKAKKKKMKQQQQNASNGNSSSNETTTITTTKVNKSDDSVNKNSSKQKEASDPGKKGRSKMKPNSDQDNARGSSGSQESSSSNEMETAVAPVSTPRKRSELKIENLNSANNNRNNESKRTEFEAANSKPSKGIDDFPALGRASSRPPGLPSPPPGFTAPVATNPPPGFLCSRLNELTFTNSSGESYAIVPDETGEQQQLRYTYLPPVNFQRRNQNLIAEFNDCFGSEESEDLKTFRYLSQLFRTGGCDANEYYKWCRSVMGASAFNRVFPELLALLPDIEKQRQLFEVHKRETGSKVGGLVACANCGQILRGSDLQDHASSHTLENHFPVLGKVGSPGNSSPWNKK